MQKNELLHNLFHIIKRFDKWFVKYNDIYNLLFLHFLGGKYMKDSKKIAYRVSIISILVNIILFLFKFISGILSHSSAIISDAIHSLSDIISTIIVIVGIKLSNKQADREHPYGHERLECLAALLLAIILFVIGISIGYQGILAITTNKYEVLPIPGALALMAAFMSIVIKEAMYWYTRYYAKKIDSQALMADAWHHRSDSFSSIGSFIGIFVSRLGFPIFAPLAGIVICFFILKAAIDIFKDAMDRLIDKSCDDKTIEQIKEIILENDEVLAVDCIMTRLFGNKIYVDVEIKICGERSLKDAHEVAEQIHDRVEEQLPFVKHCMIHINPS